MPPLQPHPDNPRYFLFRGRPTVLVASGEHYGAVLNLDFDYHLYLRTLAAVGLNHTRIFVGAYCEHPEAFNITKNTLAPAAGRFVCPWARSGEPGYANGGNRFDLTRWDDDYFARLREFVAEAGRQDVVVEVNLFCPFYKEEMWQLSPMKASNNVNGIGDVGRDQVYTAPGESGDTGAGLLAVQEAMTRRVVSELRDADNVTYEVMNEPYVRDVPFAWQARIVEVLREAEARLGPDHEPHLISINVANRTGEATQLFGAPVPPGVGLLNYHYAWPPAPVAQNRDLGLAIGDNETGFAGQEDGTYRREAWAFLLAGGAVFNHLDYSFAVGHEDGSFAYPETQPGGGSASLRASFGALKRFMDGLDFVRMEPVDNWAGDLPEGVSVFGLREPGRQLAAYLCRSGDAPVDGPVMLAIDWPAGTYRLDCVDPEDGNIRDAQQVEHPGGEWDLDVPAFEDDVALRIVAM
jgi:hypothetical protein